MFRSTLLLGATAAALSACSANLMQPDRTSPRQQARLDRALAGKVAQAPVDCLPTYRSADMEVIDDNTILFHDGSNRVYVQHPNGGCSPIGSGHYTLVTQIQGGTLCRGDISKVVDLTAGFQVGSCSMGSFTPYVTPRR